MDRPAIGRPSQDEYPPGITRYLEAVHGDDLFAAFDSQLAAINARLERIDESKAHFRYAEDKWSINELLVHLCDSERVFSYRAMRIARGDDTPLPGFDEQEYAAASGADRRGIGHILLELRAIRASTVALFESFETDDLDRRGVANTRVISVRAVGWMAVGHFAHHLNVLAERYGV